MSSFLVVGSQGAIGGAVSRLLLTNPSCLGPSFCGPITLPPATSVSIGGDGTVSLIPAGQAGAVASTAGKLKVISATTAQLERSGNGLFSAKKGFVPEPATGAVLTTGALESSNVNVADAMVTMIELARNFELQTRAMKAADENAQQAASLVRMK